MNFNRYFLPRFWGASSGPRRPGMLILRALLALVVLLPITPSQAFSPQNDTDVLPTWTKYFADSPAFFQNMTDRSLAINPATGEPCVAYGGDALYYSCKQKANDIWTTQIVDPNVQVGEYAAVDYNSKGRPFITYYDAYNGRAKLAYFNGSSWHLLVIPDADTEITAMADSAAPQSPSQPQLDESGMIPPPTNFDEEIPGEEIEVEDVGAPFEVNVEEQPVSVQAEPTVVVPADPAEQAAPTEQAGPTAEPMAVDGTPEPTAQTTPEPAQVEDETTMAERIQEVLQPWLQPNDPNFPFESTGYGKYTSIAIDRRDGVHITYHDEIDGSLEYVYWDGFDWWDVIVDDPHDQGDVGLWSSVTVDYYYNVYIAYMDEKYDNLKFAFHSGSNPPSYRWRIETVDGIETQVNMGSFSSIALEQDLTGDNEKTFTPHISYYDFTHDTLRHAWRRWDNDNDRYYWQVETVDNGGTNGNTGWYTSIAVDGNDVVHISYFNVAAGDLRYARKSGNTWTRSTLDSSGPSLVGLYTSIAINPLQQPCISYLHGNTGQLRVICRVNTNQNRWKIFGVVQQGHDVGQATSLSVDSNSQVHVSYLDVTSGYLKYVRSFGPAFVHKTFSGTYSGRFSAIDTLNGYPRIAYDEQGQQEVMYASQNASGWFYSQVDKTYNVGQFVSMKLDGNGRPHMSYYDATHDNLVYANFPVGATTWMTTTVDIESDDVGWFTSLAIDSNNTPWIAYHDHNARSLKIAMRSPTTGTWVPRTVESIGDLPVDLDDGDEWGVGWYASLALDGNNLPHISYYNFATHSLRYAYYTGEWGSVGAPGQWNFVTVDSGTGLDVGRYTSLAVNRTTGMRHICYYDLTNKNLKYARWTSGIGWERQVVDGSTADGDSFDEGDVGLFCSIDLSPAGNPVISYYDNSGADLKIATSYSLTIPPGTLVLPVVYKPLPEE